MEKIKHLIRMLQFKLAGKRPIINIKSENVKPDDMPHIFADIYFESFKPLLRDLIDDEIKKSKKFGIKMNQAMVEKVAENILRESMQKHWADFKEKIGQGEI